MIERKPEATREEWLARLPAASQQLAANRKAEEARAQKVNNKLDEEFAAESEDPTLRRRNRLKASIVALITDFESYGPMLRSQIYETLHGGRHKDIFVQAVQELVDDGDIVQTERRDGPRGRMGVAYERAAARAAREAEQRHVNVEEDVW